MLWLIQNRNRSFSSQNTVKSWGYKKRRLRGPCILLSRSQQDCSVESFS